MEKLNHYRLHKYDVHPGEIGPIIPTLNYNEGIKMKLVEEDIANGATQFKAVKSYVEEGVYPYTVIKASSEEEGLMAVEELAALGYEKECEPFDGKYGCMPYRFYEYSEDYPDMDSEFGIPIVYYDQMVEAEKYQPVSVNGSLYAATPIGTASGNPPFWQKKRTDAICIVIDGSKDSDGFDFFTGTQQSKHTMAERLSQFYDYQFVYVVYVTKGDPSAQDAEDEFGFCNSQNESELFEAILKHSAGVVELSMEPQERLAYYKNVFYSNVIEANRELEENFPIDEVVNRIVIASSANKCETIRLAVQYVVIHGQGRTILSAADFHMLYNYSSHGATESGSRSAQQTLKEDIVGLENVKRKIERIVNQKEYSKKREEAGLGRCGFHNVHCLIGAPGTAKTTVAQLFGAIMNERHLLEGNRFISVNGAELKGMFVGHSAPKVHSIFENNDIILIDEAYSIVQDDAKTDSFGQEALAQLIIELENHSMDKLILFSGYGGTQVTEQNNKMKQFIEANPGIRSRINSTIYFDSYSVEQMTAIFTNLATRQHFSLEPTALPLLKEFFAERMKDPNFGNGREARALLENATAFAAERVMQLPTQKQTKKKLSKILASDVRNAIHEARMSVTLQTGKEKKSCGFAID